MKKITRFLWWCAGARPEILESCTLDHAKYFGIGGTILFTALMASFAGGYAFFTAFKQVSETFGADGVTKIETILPVSYYLAISFGIFWGLLIFNLDRYIVATIKDDGKASISKGEWQNAAPRLIMAILLGLVISTPLELKLFEKEINVEVKNIIRDERAKLGNDETPILKLIAKKENEKLQLKKDQIEAENKPNALPNTTNQPEDLKVQLLNDQIPQVESDIKANKVMWDKLDMERKVAENNNDTEQEKRLRIKRNKYDNSANYTKKQKLLDDITTQKNDKINRQMQLITDATQLKKINQPQIEALNEEIKTVNEKLIQMSNEIQTLSNKLKPNNSEHEEAIREINGKIERLMPMLCNKKNEFVRNDNELTDLIGQEHNSKIVEESSNMKYILLFICMIIIIIVLIKSLTNPYESSVEFFIFILISIVVIYQIIMWILNKFT